jgi:hypothetical protein
MALSRPRVNFSSHCHDYTPLHFLIQGRALETDLVLEYGIYVTCNFQLLMLVLQGLDLLACTLSKAKLRNSDAEDHLPKTRMHLFRWIRLKSIHIKHSKNHGKNQNIRGERLLQYNHSPKLTTNLNIKMAQIVRYLFIINIKLVYVALYKIRMFQLDYMNILHTYRYKYI